MYIVQLCVGFINNPKEGVYFANCGLDIIEKLPNNEKEKKAKVRQALHSNLALAYIKLSPYKKATES